jgi:hypothetical protein
MITTTTILWTVYFALLGVLLPHTAWAFRQFEPLNSMVIVGKISIADVISYVVAFAFEASIAVLTHKLAKRIEQTPKRHTPWQKFSFQYGNAIAFGLLISTAVSGMANLAHAVQFGRTLEIFTRWGIPQNVYSFAFGGILPLVSLTFARVLSNVVDDEEAPNPEVEQAKATVSDLRSKLRDAELRMKATEDNLRKMLADYEAAAKITEENLRKQLMDSEDRARLAEERFGAMGDLVKHLFAEDKKQRIIVARKQWPSLPGSALAIIAGSSPAYVSEVLRDVEVVDA